MRLNDGRQTDKTGLGTMNLFGLQKDTGMHGTQYSLLTVMFCEFKPNPQRGSHN